MSQHNPVEINRLEQLRNLRLLDTGNEEIYDAFTSLASEIFETPIVLLSLVDENRQWFKSIVGENIPQETLRCDSFCAHAILNTGIFEIEDARKNPVFANNPLVLGFPSIVFYAGAPISFNGANIGTLCIIDHQPRVLNEKEKALLLKLASAVSIALSTRNTYLDGLTFEVHRNATIIESTEDAVFSITPKGFFVTLNQATEALFEYRNDELLGRSIELLIPAGGVAREVFNSNGQIINNHVAQFITKSKQLITLSISVTPLKNKFGEEIGVAVIARKVNDNLPG